MPRCPRTPVAPAWPGRAPLDSHADTHRLSGTAIEPSESRPTPATGASTEIDGMRSLEGGMGPAARWNLSSTGAGAGLPFVTTVSAITSAAASSAIGAAAAIGAEGDVNALDRGEQATTHRRTEIARKFGRRRRCRNRRDLPSIAITPTQAINASAASTRKLGAPGADPEAGPAVFGNPGKEMMLVGSLAVLLMVLVSPPPLTTAWCTTEFGAVCRTVTVIVIAGYAPAAASTLERVHVTV